MGGSDCELLGDGWLAQPANAWSSVAYVVAAAYVLARGRRWQVPLPVLAPAALALTLVGIGSFAFHGPQPGWADAAHDGSIAAVLLVHLLVRPDRPHRICLAAGASFVAFAVVAAVPSSDLLLHGALAVAVAALELRRRGTPPVAVAALAAGAVVLALGRTGGALCDPNSLLQAHAGWHVLSAVAAGTALARTLRG